MTHPNIVLATQVLAFVRGDWLNYSWPREAQRFLPSLLLGVYVSHLQGHRPTMREGAAFMHADPTTSGPKYIRQAAEAGLIRIENHPHDKRKYILTPTELLIRLINTELSKITTAAQ